MSDYSRSITIETTPDKAFAFVSDVSNLPRYVPTTQRAEESGKGKVHVEGVSRGEHYSDDGHIHVDPDRRLMRWGSGESAYRGELAVGEAGADAEITIKLHFNDSSGHVPDSGQIERSLDESLDRLRRELVG